MKKTAAERLIQMVSEEGVITPSMGSANGGIVAQICADHIRKMLPEIEREATMALSTNRDDVLNLLIKYGQYDGESHHQTWLLDQIVRILTGDEYTIWADNYTRGADGFPHFIWEKGIAP